MKKLSQLLAALVMVVLAMPSLSAKNYVVWSGDALTADEEILPTDWYGWWNISTPTVDDADSPEGKAVKWAPAGNGAAFSGGIYIGDNNHVFDMSLLAEMDLVFYMKVVGNPSLTLRLTGADTGDVDFKLSPVADGAYHEVRLSIKDKFPKAYTAWSKAATDANYMKGYVFALVGDGDPTCEVYTADIHYESSIPMPSITAEATNITATSADIVYSVNFAEGYSNTAVTINGVAVDAAGTYKLTELTERTAYSYTIVATGEYQGATYSAEKVVSFKTPAEGAVDYVYADLTKSELKNAYRIGEEPSMARSIFVSLPWKVTYTSEGTGVYAIDLSQIENVVGLVPQIWINQAPNFRTLTKNAETGWFEVDLGEQTADAEVQISHYLAYAGGAFDQRTPYTVWGMEKEAPEVGDAAKLTFSLSNDRVKAGESVMMTTVATDAAGYYLAADGVEYEADPAVSFDGNFAKVSESKGDFVITAKAGGLSASATLHVIASPEAVDLAHGVSGETDTENVIENTNAANATDGNIGTELRWGCGQTQEHYLAFDFVRPGTEEGYYIEAIDLLFEGAYATDFSITLSNSSPAPAAMRAPATDDVVINITGGNTTSHLFTMNPTGSHRYVTLNTTKALNAGWGIKIKEIKVYGTENAPSTSGVESVAVESDSNASVEYFNLQGQRIANPAAGQVVIRRQGSSVSKLIVK